MTVTGISVVVPVRNGESFLGEALDSIAAQDVDGLETIVIDDGSTDRTSEIANGHSLRPHVINRQHSGLPASMNAGVEAASKDFIAFLDADDVWPPHRLREMRQVFEVDPRIELVSGQLVNTDATLKPIRAPMAARILTCCLWRRQLFNKVGAFRTDINHASNVDWLVRAKEMGIPMAQLDLVVLLRRIHSDNMGVRDTARGRLDLLRVVRDHRLRSQHG